MQDNAGLPMGSVNSAHTAPRDQAAACRHGTKMHTASTRLACNAGTVPALMIWSGVMLISN